MQEETAMTFHSRRRYDDIVVAAIGISLTSTLLHSGQNLCVHLLPNILSNCKKATASVIISKYYVLACESCQGCFEGREIFNITNFTR